MSFRNYQIQLSPNKAKARAKAQKKHLFYQVKAMQTGFVVS